MEISTNNHVKKSSSWPNMKTGDPVLSLQLCEDEDTINVFPPDNYK